MGWILLGLRVAAAATAVFVYNSLVALRQRLPHTHIPSISLKEEIRRDMADHPEKYRPKGTP